MPSQLFGDRSIESYFKFKIELQLISVGPKTTYTQNAKAFESLAA